MRRWTAPQAGTVHITGNASDADPNCGDGVVVSIQKGGQVLWQQTIENGNGTGVSYDVTTTLTAGTQINFVINRHSNNWCDSTNFDPTISYTSSGTEWLVADHLGTPRMVVDQTGSLAGIKRHDYLPFGEELFVGTGGRTTAQGYGQVDNVRQHFTGEERDSETGLDYLSARYYASALGRFSSADSFGGSIADPQTLNRYAYVGNNPLAYTDPTGHERFGAQFSSSTGEGGFGYPDNDSQLPERYQEEIASWTALDSAQAGKAGEMDADEGTAGKADLGAVESSQNTLTEDDPDTIPSEGNSANCGISVSFKSGMYFSTEGQSLPNGPSTIRLNGQDNFRLGFTVKGWVDGAL